MVRYIGIDFGTSSTVVYTKDFRDDVSDSQPQPILVAGNPVIPSVAFVVNDDFENAENFVFGRDAETCQLEGNTYRNFKLDLASTDDKIVERAKRLVSEFFRWLNICYNEQKLYLGICEEERTFISYPVKWSTDLREYMKKAAVDAGFHNVHGMDEATAAIQGLLYSNLETLQRYGILKRDQQLRVMLLDMGAGTSDIVLGVFSTSTKELTVIDTYPNSGEDVYYGGREFDEAVCDFIGDYLHTNGINYDGAADQERLLCDCKSWKENTLSPCLRKDQQITKLPPFIMMLTTHLGDTRSPFPIIDRKLFETTFANHINSFAELIENALESTTVQESKIDFRNDVDVIVLTGGHSQWYFVKELLSGKMLTPSGKDVSFSKVVASPEKLLQLPRPSETVALGLVNGDEEVNLADVSDYNIWFSAVIGDEECPPLLVISKNELLPFANNKIVYEESLDCGQYVLTSCDFDFDLFIKYRISVSKDRLENAQTYEDEFRISCKTGRAKLSYRGKQLAAISGGMSAFQIKDRVTIALKVTMAEGQCVELHGLVFSDKHMDKRFAKQLNLKEGGGKADAL